MPAGFCGVKPSVYRIPGLIVFLLKCSQVNIDLYPVLALEGFWYSPRVPAGASSAVLEFARGENFTFLVDYF
ncbi:MAG: hypothetical protein ACYSWP_23900 [Planctomycetota bacterium]|jgi:hypothetical protein